MATPAKHRGNTTSKKASWVGWLVLGLLVAPCVIFGLFDGSDSTDVPAPAADERADTVPLLKEAFTSQGICYGWRLEGGFDEVSVGSNLGDGVPAADAPGCPRWIQVDADVTYTSESSESSDSAWVQVKGSDDIDAADLYTIRRGLERFGLDDDAFVDDPGWAVTRAATVLPLLAVEAGLAEPAATPTAGPTAAASPLPAAGNDLLRDRWGWLLAAVGLALLAALFITVGVVQRRRTTAPGRGAAPDAPSRSGRKLRGVVPAQRAGAEPAGRTPERA